MTEWPASGENTNIAFRPDGEMIEFANSILKLNR